VNYWNLYRATLDAGLLPDLYVLLRGAVSHRLRPHRRFAALYHRSSSSVTSPLCTYIYFGVRHSRAHYISLILFSPDSLRCLYLRTEHASEPQVNHQLHEATAGADGRLHLPVMNSPEYPLPALGGSGQPRAAAPPVQKRVAFPCTGGFR
jgi:hypothetical protein